jgi:large subunit ribosomal protein L32
MALPKRKMSKSRRDKRQGNKKVALANLTTCPQCNEPKLPHHVCQNCGYYKGRPVIQAEEV